MYSIEQLQAFDFLLKKIIQNKNHAISNKNLKLVIEVNNRLWYGDLIEMNGSQASQLYIDDIGEIESVWIYHTGDNASHVVKETWDAYCSIIAKYQTNFYQNPFKEMDNLPLLFHTLKRIIDKVDIPKDTSPFYPYLLNAHSLDDKYQLPFIDLSSQSQFNLVSLIELP